MTGCRDFVCTTVAVFSTHCSLIRRQVAKLRTCMVLLDSPTFLPLIRVVGLRKIPLPESRILIVQAMAGYTQDGHIGLANLEVNLFMYHQGTQSIANTFQAFVWTMTAITVLLSAARYAISVAEKKSLQWDNLTHLLALLAMVTMVALLQTLFRDGYYITAIDRQLVPNPDRAAFVELYIRFRRRSDAIALLFFTSTWLVKLTFLLYYRSIFKISKNFRKAWWAVTIFVFITYWVTVAAVLTQCGPAKNSFSLGK